MAKPKQLNLEAKILNDEALAQVLVELEDCEESMREKDLREALTRFNRLRRVRGELKEKILGQVVALDGASDKSRQFIVNEVHELTIKTSIRPATKTEAKVLRTLNLKLLGDGDDDGS